MESLRRGKIISRAFYGNILNQSKEIIVKLVFQALALAASCLLFSGTAPAAQDHSRLLNGPFKTGPEVTKACMQCHEQHAKDFMKTQHWTWSFHSAVDRRNALLPTVCNLRREHLPAEEDRRLRR